MAHDVWDTEPEYWAEDALVECTPWRTNALNHEAAVGLAMEQQAKLRHGWYAHSRRYMARIGPFDNEEAARGAMRLTPRARAEQKVYTGSDYPYPIDMLIWKEP